MCTKEEVREVVKGLLVETNVKQDNIMQLIAEVKRSFNQLPCQQHNDRILELKFRHDAIDKEVNYMVKDVYPRLIDLEKDNATTKEKGRGIDASSIKTWGLIITTLGFLFMLATSMIE
jgi:hypothetical protein